MRQKLDNSYEDMTIDELEAELEKDELNLEEEEKVNGDKDKKDKDKKDKRSKKEDKKDVIDVTDKSKKKNKKDDKDTEEEETDIEEIDVSAKADRLIVYPTEYQRAEQAPRILSPSVAYEMAGILRDVVQRGTATRARVLGRADIGGKTGTTNNFRDAWFAGFHPTNATVVWIGFDQPSTLGHRQYGGTLALPVWIDFMRFKLQNTPHQWVTLGNDANSKKKKTKTIDLTDKRKKSKKDKDEEKKKVEKPPMGELHRRKAPPPPPTPAPYYPSSIFSNN